MSKPSILVFAYHDVGFECLDALIQNDEYILAVITHKDDPEEDIWFRSVSKLAEKYDIPVHTPDTVNSPDWIERIRSWAPDLILSFYYRNMIHDEVLNTPRLGACNMHGSLLPKYRGLVPINWAILNGELSTGVTLHHMVKRANAGDIVDQEAVPIGPEDTVRDVFSNCVQAARLVLERQIDALTAGTAPRRSQDDSQATYFGKRTPEDGRIDWNHSAEQIYNLIRSVTQPYPGAFTMVGRKKLLIWWAVPRSNTEGKPGTVTSLEPLIMATGSGSLEVVNYEWEDENESELTVGHVMGNND
jgi:methionyl-tRNA formyltransferase